MIFFTVLTNFVEKMADLRLKGTVKEFQAIEYRADWLHSKYVGTQVLLLPDPEKTPSRL